MPGSKRGVAAGPWTAFGVLCLVSAGVQLLPLLYGGLEGDLPAALAALHPYAVLPIALSGPFLAARKGVPPIAAFFPPGLFFLLNPFYPGQASFGCALLLLSMLSACAGQAWERRGGGKGPALRRPAPRRRRK